MFFVTLLYIQLSYLVICPYTVPIQTVDGKHLGAFNRMSKDAVSKLLSKSKTTNCSTDPIPTKLVKDHKDVLLPLLTHNQQLSSLWNLSR